MIHPHARAVVEENVVRLGLKDKLAGIRPIPVSIEEQMAEMASGSARCIENFMQVARELIADGAEVVFPACGATSPMLRLAPGAKDYPNGVTEVDGVPVVDIISTAVKLAETLVSLKRAGSSWISRKATNARPSPSLLAASREFLAPVSGGVWRVSEADVAQPATA